MNSYRVNYQRPDGQADSIQIIERSEQAARVAARRKLKEIYNGAPQAKNTITEVELVGEDAIATKQQERDTLAAIRQMVEELGPQSYLATAFAGCFEDAENNIENDFGDSMKARFEKADEEAKYFNRAADMVSAELDEARAEIERLKKRNDELGHKLLSPDDLMDCIALASNRASEHKQQMDEAAARIVEFASEPASPEFLQAVTDNRNAKSALEYVEALEKRLNRIVDAGT